MSNIMNPKPRFGYTPGADLIYDYLTQRDVAPGPKPYEAIDGTWDLNEVKRTILASENIESAHLTVRKPTAAQPTPAAAPVAAKTFPVGAPLQPKAEVSLAALSPQQLQALKLSALQMAAMGITPTQLEVTGITAQQVKNWALTEARCHALALTPEQRAVLMP